MAAESWRGPLVPQAERRNRANSRKTKTFTLREVAKQLEGEGLDVRRTSIVSREGMDVEMRVALKELQLARPRTREQCRDGIRPCPFVGCRFHLFLEVTVSGGLKLVYPGAELEELEETCALDVAERGGMSLEAVGTLLNQTRERVRQIELVAIGKYRERFMGPAEGR